MVGRVKRPWPGKPDSILLDHAGCVARRGPDGWERNHGHPDEDREWLLTEDRKTTAAKLDRDPSDIKVCPRCGAVYDSEDIEVCACGYVFAKNRRKLPEHQDGTLEELLAGSLRNLPERQKKVQWWKLRRTADRNGMKPGWAGFKYRDAFGTWPPREWENEYVEYMRRIALVPVCVLHRRSETDWMNWKPNEEDTK
jgi:hypothetical protein